MNAITTAIQSKIVEFSKALSTGKLEWTAEELVQYVAEPKETPAAATLFPDLGLGPADKARGALCARILSGALGVDLDKKNGKYVFSQPSGNTAITKLQAEIAKFEYKDANNEAVSKDQVRHSQLVYPETPVNPPAYAEYVEPNWYKLMVAMIDSGRHISLAGPPGCGKSTGPEQYFIRKGQPYVVVNGDAGLRRRDLEGTPNIDKAGSWFQVAEFAAAAVNGWGCILNEVNAADPDALLWLNGIIETPNRITIGGRTFPVHPNFRLFVTYNPGLIGTKVLPQAFKDRFFPIKLGFPPKAFLRKLLIVKGMNPDAPYADKLLKYTADCWTLHEKGNLRYQISPRRLFDVALVMDKVPGTSIEEAIKRAIVDSVDSVADAQMLSKLITAPLAEVGPVSQFA